MKIWGIHRKEFTYYESIEFLPIWNYRKVEETMDFRYLIKGIDYENLPNINIDKIDIWEIIHNQYISEIDPELFNDIKSQFVQIEAKRREAIFLNGCLNILSVEKKPELIARIKNLGYKFNDSTTEAYFDSLISLGNQIKGILKMVDLQSGNFEKKYLNQNQVKEDLETILVKFTEKFGVVFNSKQLTTKQYIHYLKRYNKLASIAAHGK